MLLFIKITKHYLRPGQKCCCKGNASFSRTSQWKDANTRPSSTRHSWDL